MKRLLIVLSVSLFPGAQALSGELDIAKGFFDVPWGASPQEAVRILKLEESKAKIEKEQSKHHDCLMRFTRGGTSSVLYFYKGKLVSFTRNFEMGDVPDASTEDWAKVFREKFKAKFGQSDEVRFTVSSCRAKSDVSIMLHVTNVKLEKQAIEEGERAKKAKIEEAFAKILSF